MQALLHKYETFHRADGHVVKLPMDRGEGQQWNRAPGNLYSAPHKATLDPRKAEVLEIVLDRVIPPIPDPPGTRLFPGRARPAALGIRRAPAGAYPLVIHHGHFPHTFDGSREEPPDPKLECEHSERYNWPCYNA